MGIYFFSSLPVYESGESGDRSNSVVLAIRYKTLYFTNSARFNQFKVVFSHLLIISFLQRRPVKIKIPFWIYFQNFVRFLIQCSKRRKQGFIIRYFDLTCYIVPKGKRHLRQLKLPSICHVPYHVTLKGIRLSRRLDSWEEAEWEKVRDSSPSSLPPYPHPLSQAKRSRERGCLQTVTWIKTSRVWHYNYSIVTIWYFR